MENFNWSTFLLTFVITWVVLKIFQSYLEVKNEQLIKELTDLQEKVKKAIIKVNVEKHGDVFYLFEKETDRFIAQGRDADEIKTVLEKYYPNKTVFADKQHLETIGLKL